MNKISYTYETDLNKGERQYDSEYNLEYDKIVNARYVRTYRDSGNPYIEALPKARNIEEISLYYNKMISIPTDEELKDMDTYEVLESISMLKDIRFSLPFHADIEREFRRALEESYRHRVPLEDKECDVDVTMYGKENVMHRKLVAKDVSESNTGFTLLGYSGCGKSTGIRMMLTNYPQVIIHNPDTWNRFPQIVYLIVNCVPNSNFSALYTAIGTAIDRALGNLKPVYEDVVGTIKNLGKQHAKVKELVELFAIGIIIFDEIQLIDLKGTRENSIEGLLTLNNETNVAIAVVGTEDAFENLFTKRRTSRRTGVLVQASKYCTDIRKFTVLVKHLFSFQWFEQRIEVTGEMIDALYKVTDGVIDQLIQVYTYMQIDYVKSRKKPVVNEDYIIKVANRHFKGLQDVITNGKMKENKRVSFSMEDIRLIVSPGDLAEQEEAEQRLSQLMESKTVWDLILMKENVVKNIQNQTDAYNSSTIENAFNKVMSKKENKGISEMEATLKSLEQLQKMTTDRRRKDKKQSQSVLDIKKARQALLDSSEQ